MGRGREEGGLGGVREVGEWGENIQCSIVTKRTTLLPGTLGITVDRHIKTVASLGL